MNVARGVCGSTLCQKKEIQHPKSPECVGWMATISPLSPFLFLKPGAALYVVIGSVGAYSDRTEYAVAAYTSRAEADQHSDLAVREEKWLEKAVENHPAWSPPFGANKYAPQLRPLDDRPGDFYVAGPIPILNSAGTAPEELQVFEDWKKENERPE